MAIDELTFDEDAHAYKLDGRIVPSVTQIIGRVLPGFQAGEYYLNRGKALHYATELLDKGVLNWDSVDPAIEPRVKAWKKFKSESGCKVLEIEKRCGSQIHMYAGTIDRIVELNGFKYVLDIKSSVSPQAMVQLGGYSVLYRAETGMVLDGGAVVELRENGTYAVKWLNNRELANASNTFLACLTVHNFMIENKIFA